LGFLLGNLFFFFFGVVSVWWGFFDGFYLWVAGFGLLRTAIIVGKTRLGLRCCPFLFRFLLFRFFFFRFLFLLRFFFLYLFLYFRLLV